MESSSSTFTSSFSESSVVSFASVDSLSSKSFFSDFTSFFVFSSAFSFASVVLSESALIFAESFDVSIDDSVESFGVAA